MARSALVEIRPFDDPDIAIERALQAVDHCLAADGLDSTVVHFRDTATDWLVTVR